MNVAVIERLRLVTPLGIRFWDAATDQPLTSGLRVTARPENFLQPVITAQPTRSGIYAFHHLPGLRDFEYAGNDFALEAPIPATKRYVIRVEDESNRFLPVAFVATAPFAGIFPTGLGSQSLPAPLGFDLFSSPVRSTPLGLAEVRADLLDVSQQPPVSGANALMEIIAGPNQHYHGLSDANGKATVFFPYPPVAIVLANSPPAGTMIALSEQRWKVRVRLRYSPGTVTGLAGVAEPNLRTVLEQTAGAAFLQSGAAGVEEFEQEIAFGKPTVLRTANHSELWIRSRSSPP